MRIKYFLHNHSNNIQFIDIVWFVFLYKEQYEEAEIDGNDIKGIPSFWFQAMTYHPATRNYIQYEDAEVGWLIFMLLYMCLHLCIAYIHFLLHEHSRQHISFFHVILCALHEFKNKLFAQYVIH